MRNRMYRSRATVVGLLALIVGLLAGCGGIAEQTVGDDGPMFFVHGRTVVPSGGMDALVSGALASADGCVLLAAGPIRYPVVWPAGTSVAATDPLVLELASGEQLHLGDRVSGGGGYLASDELDIAVPDSCLNKYGEVAVFNADTDLVREAD